MNISSPDWVDGTTVKYEQRQGDIIKIWYGTVSPVAPGANWTSALRFINDLPATIWRSDLGAVFGTEYNIRWETEPRETYRVVPAASTEERLRKTLLEIEWSVEARNYSLRADWSDNDYFEEIGVIVHAAVDGEADHQGRHLPPRRRGRGKG